MRLFPPIRSFIRPVVGPPPAVLAIVAAVALVASARADNSDWPRQFDSPNGSFVIYQPQPEDLTRDLLSCRAAFALQKSGDANPIYGVLWFTERIAIDRDSSTVTVRNLDVTKVRMPDITPAEAGRYEKLVEDEATRWDLSGSVEELQAGLAASEKERASVANLDNTPPHILFSTQRAFLLAYDGVPTLEPIDGSDLQRVSNTPYAVIYDPSNHSYYIAGANLWYSAKDPLGPWSSIREAPARVRRIVPPDTSSDDQVAGPAPLVITATEPTELISMDGPAQYAPLVGSDLLYVTNTESDVVREVPTQALYVLLSGRWYRSASQSGPWAFVRGDQLPASFRKVPPDSPKGNILASVAGTDQADDAVADAEIPQTTAIQQADHNFNVNYDGMPQFEPIAHTRMEYAINADAEVIAADGKYYACDQGVWYISISPDGPWHVSETRPVQVDDIAPDCPVYNVRYVYIYDSTPTAVYMGYLPGYLGCYPYYGTVVHGTGYHYRPWRGRHRYFARPLTWGFHARYNPWLSRWSYGFSYCSGFLRVGFRWHSWPNAAQHHGPPMWFGPGGYRRPMLAADRTPLRVRRLGRSRRSVPDPTPANLYNRSQNVVRVDRIAMRMPVRPTIRTEGRGPIRPSMRPVAQPAHLPNNVFAGKNGRVYQRDDGGSWKIKQGRSWIPARLPVAAPAPSYAPGREVRGGSAPQPSWPPEQPVLPPMPAQPPGGDEGPRRVGPRANPAMPSSPAMPATTAPGDLEGAYRARQRANPGPPPGAAAPQSPPESQQPAPAPPEREKERSPAKRKP
jgi:hypothetical protein